jgi:NTP pyrophosphatase (non-canonical NTP hydrolase)
LDVENAAEELGDSLWFIALGAKRLGISMEDLAKQNIEKLSKRYPEKYTDALAHARLDKA